MNEIAATVSPSMNEIAMTLLPSPLPSVNEIAATVSLSALAPSAIPTTEPAMLPTSVEPSSPPSSFSDDEASIGDGMETETVFTHEDDTNKKSGNYILPWKGMAFASLEEFETFYYNFSISEGYTVRVRRTINFAHTDKIRYRQYVCSCAGFCEEKKSNDVVALDKEKKSRKTLTRRSGCPVYISVSNKNGIWKVGKIKKEHNHLLVSPNSRIYLKQPGGMPSVAKNLVEKFSETDLPIGRVPDIVNCDASINVSQRGCWNMVEHPSIANPSIAKTKGRKKEDVSVSKNGRFKSGLEVRMKNSKKSKRQCKNCGQYGHYSSTCERRKQADVIEDAHTKED